MEKLARPNALAAIPYTAPPAPRPIDEARLLYVLLTKCVRKGCELAAGPRSIYCPAHAAQRTLAEVRR